MSASVETEQPRSVATPSRPSWLKAPDTLVLRARDGGLDLVRPEGGRTEHLRAEEAAVWTDWNSGRADASALGARLRFLSLGGFVRAASAHAAEPYLPTPADSLSLRVRHGFVRWYQESPDLCVLFGTEPAPHNPVLSLGPYGTHCWQGLVQGLPVQTIRRSVRALFGTDDAVEFLARLMRLGLIEREPALESVAGQSPAYAELPNGLVQHSLFHAAAPWYCLWETNTTCDLRCQTCYLPQFGHAGLDADHAQEIAEQIIEAQVLSVALFGGESLLRGDLELIVARLRRAGVFVKLITNGLSLSLERARGLSDAGLNQLEVSFDGLSMRSHELSRGPGTFSQACAAVACAQRAGIARVGVVVTFHSDTLRELTGLPEFLRNLSVTECYLSAFKRTGLLGSRAPWQTVQPDNTAWLRSLIGQWRTDHPELVMVLLPTCTCGRTSVVIGHDGGLRPCSFSQSRIGSLQDERLVDLWRRLGQVVPSSGPFGFCDPATARLVLEPALADRQLPGQPA